MGLLLLLLLVFVVVFLCGFFLFFVFCFFLRRQGIFIAVLCIMSCGSPLSVTETVCVRHGFAHWSVVCASVISYTYTGVFFVFCFLFFFGSTTVFLLVHSLIKGKHKC